MLCVLSQLYSSVIVQCVSEQFSECRISPPKNVLKIRKNVRKLKRSSGYNILV